MKRTIHYKKQIDDGYTITNFYDSYTTKTAEEFALILSRFYKDNDDDKIDGIEINCKLYSLREYLNHFAPIKDKTALKKLYAEFGKRI